METFRTYKIKPIRRLGSGAFGYVEEIELYGAGGYFCGSFARKVLSPNESIKSQITDSEIKRRFVREAVYQSNCFSEHVINVYLLNNYSVNPYFVMDLGCSDLRKEMDFCRFSYEEKLDIFKMVSCGLKAIHDRDYFHRDIKPQNIIRFGDSYKISDFGLVKNNDSSVDTTALTAIGAMMGTRSYMAPEILYNGEYSKQTDIYALGQVMDELFSSSSIELSSIIKKCTKMEKRERYSSVDDILNDLANLESAFA